MVTPADFQFGNNPIFGNFGDLLFGSVRSALISGKLFLFRSPDHQMHRSPDPFRSPPGISLLSLQMKAFPGINPRVPLAGRLGDPCVTLGSPLGHPIPIPIRQRVAKPQIAQSRRFASIARTSTSTPPGCQLGFQRTWMVGSQGHPNLA